MTSVQNRFVVVAPMYNAGDTLQQFLTSIAAQSYDNWHVILIDDVSTTDHARQEWEIIQRWRDFIEPGVGLTKKFTVVWNDTKRWEVANVLHGISLCGDEDIICRIDCDDRLVDNDAFYIINDAYNKTGCDVAWSMHRWGKSDRNISAPLAPDADPYTHPWVTSHLKTFRKRMINGIPDENFRGPDGEYIKRAGDQAIYLPILHNTRKRLFIPRVFYGYSIDEQNGAIYQSDDAKFQKSEADFIRTRGYVE